MKTAYQIGVLKATQDAGFIKYALMLPWSFSLPFTLGGLGASTGAVAGEIGGNAGHGTLTGLGAGVGSGIGGIGSVILGLIASKGKMSESMLDALGLTGATIGAAGGGLAGYKLGG